MTAETWTARADIHSPFTPRGLPHLEASLQTNTPDRKDFTADPLSEEERKLRLAALALKRMALQDLRDGLEGRAPRRATYPEGKEPAPPTWDNPFVYVAIDFPVKDHKSFAPPAELEDETQALWWIASRLKDEQSLVADKETWRSRLLGALQTLTRLAAFVVRDGKTHPIVPVPFFDRFQSMTKEEQETFLRHWFSPVSHGDSYQDEDGVRNLDASLVVTAGDRFFQAAVVFEVYPLLIDLDAGRSFYMLKAGLPWDEDGMGSPATWTEAERNALWEALFESLDKLAAYYKGDETTLPDHVEVNVHSEGPLAGVTVVRPAYYKGDETFHEAMVERLVSPDEAEAAIEATANAVFLDKDQDGGRRVFPLAFGTALADAGALAFVQQSHHLRLPRSWAKLRTWDELKTERIKEHLETNAAQGFVDRRAAGQNAFAHAKLRNVYLPGQTKPTVDLTPEEERDLRRYHGTSRGFLDRDPKGRQSLYRCVADGKGNLLEIWLSWSGMAEPLFRDRLELAKKKLLEQLPPDKPNEPELFADLDGELKRKLNRELERLNLYEHGRSVMEMVLGVFGKYRTNPVEIPAEAFRRQLWPTGNQPQDWKQIVERTLGALRGMTIFYTAGRTLKGEHGFLSGWDYLARGHGGHGEGVYLATVDKVFVGSLKVFETAYNEKLASGVDAVVYDFSKDIPTEDRKALNFVSFDAGRTFYHAAAGLTAEQRNLANWLEREITLKRDPIPKGRKQEQSKPTAKGANEPRLYEKSFCPLLPDGQFVAALGHFRRNPEAGFTLYGTASKASKASGGHVDGLVAVMGYPLAPGRAHDARRGVVRTALEDLKAVVVDYLGGVVVGKLGGRARGEDDWLALDEWTDLDEDALCRKLKVFVFLPPDWNQRRRDRFKKVTGYEVTESIEEAQAARGTAAPAKPQAEPAGIYRGEADGFAQLGPLPKRLYAALNAWNLERKDLARIFGVSKMAVTHWLRGLRLGEDPAKAKPIPADLAVLMDRWLRTRQEPAPDELAALPSRSRTPRGGVRKTAA